MSNLINLLDTYKGEKRELYPLTPSQMGVYLSWKSDDETS